MRSRAYRLQRMFVSAAAALVIGFFSVRRTGIYFAMLTFAFQMLLYTIALKATPLTGGDDGLTGLKPPGLLRTAGCYYYFALVITQPLVCTSYTALVSSPFGYTLRALRANARARAVPRHRRARCTGSPRSC